MKNIQTIFTQDDDSGKEIGRLSIDNNGNLYWNDKKVITEQKISLGFWVSLSAVLASLATVISTIYTILDYYKNA